MAKATGTAMDGYVGRINGATIYTRGKDTIIRKTHIIQPHRLSRTQLVLRERIAHNNILWRRLKAAHHTHFECGADAYRCFMSVNRLSPTVYLTKGQVSNNTSLLLPNMAVSNGPLTPISYQFGEVDGQPALLTDLTPKDIRKGEYLLYVVQQEVIHWQGGEDLPQVHISVVTVTPEQFTLVPSTLQSPYISKDGTLALVDDRFGDSMQGFALVRIQNNHVSSQHVITRCNYYERYTTEEALQAAAKSYKGLTGEKSYSTTTSV
jgi:hypothetical protein